MAANITGTVRRELSLCYLHEACAGWLPATVQLDGSWGLPATLPHLPEAEALLGGYTRDVALSPDSSKIAVALDDEMVVFDTATLTPLSRLPATDGTYLERLAWDADGTTLLIFASSNGVLEAWEDDTQGLTFFDTETGTVIQRFVDTKLIVAEQYIATWNRDTINLAIYDRLTHQLVAELTSVAAAALGPENRAATMDIETGRIDLWQIEPGTGKPFATITLDLTSDQLEYLELGYGDPRLEFVPGGAFLGFKVPRTSMWSVYGIATLSERTTFLLDGWIYSSPGVIPQAVIDQYELTVIPLDAETEIVEWPSTTWRVSGDFVLTEEVGHYTIWDRTTGQVVLSPNAWMGSLRHEIPAAVSPDGRLLALSSINGTFDEETIQIIDMETMQVIDEVNRKGYRLRWSADSRRLYVDALYSLAVIEVEG